MIDTDNAVILDVEASRSVRQAEVGAARTMLDRIANSFNLHPERLIADTAYGSAPMLNWLVQERGIAPHIPVIDKSGRKDGAFERSDFTYDADEDAYTCPGGKKLRQFRRTYKVPRSGIDKEGIMRYRAKKSDCDECGLKDRCTPKEPQRKVLRSIYEPSRDVARKITQTIDYAISCKLRKRLRCYSHTSNASLALAVCDFEDPVVQKMNSTSQQPHRTSEN